MRLIDIEPVLKVAELIGKEYVSIDLLKDFEQVDAVPVVRGEWREDYVYTSDPHDRLRYKCSVCGRIEYIKEPFCNCGAKMESEGGT